MQPIANHLLTVGKSLLSILFITTIVSCESESYETGLGENSLIEGEFVDLSINAQRQVGSFQTDDGVSYVPVLPVTASWITKADTTYRSVVYFEKRGGAFADIKSVGYMPTIIPRKPEDFKRQPQHPVGLESAWLTKTGKYINLGLLLKNGRVNDEEGMHALAIVCDEVRQNADQTRTAFYRLLHDQGDAPEYYSNRRYVSILLPDDRPDSVRLSIETYQQGTVEKRFALK